MPTDIRSDVIKRKQNATEKPGEDMKLQTNKLHLSIKLLFLCEQQNPLPSWTMASSFTGFLDHTQKRNTLGRTLLDE